MEGEVDAAGAAALGIGAVLLVVAAGLLVTGRWTLGEYALPVALAGLASVIASVQRFERLFVPE